MAALYPTGGAILAIMHALGKCLSQADVAHSALTDLQSLKHVLGAAHSIAIELRQEDDACKDRAAEVARPGDTQPLHDTCMCGTQ